MRYHLFSLSADMVKRVFSGFRPTGRQHIGNYFGTIQNCIELQESQDYECIYCVVDIHALTTVQDTSTLPQDIWDMVLDWLAAGIDPRKSIVFVQSHVPQVMELFTLFGMITPLGWLLRVPTFKEKAKMQPENVNYGLVGYPVLMTADIALYRAEVVPVGEDQLAHLELAREIVRRFNALHGSVFPEPQARLTSFPMVPGLTGREKMSKSAGNYLEVAASPEEIWERVRVAFTDPARRYKSDPGHPDVCSIHSLHRIFAPAQADEIAGQCRAATIGCVDCKKALAENIASYFAPFRERRAELASRPDYVRDVVAEGARRAGTIAADTLSRVRESMNLQMP